MFLIQKSWRIIDIILCESKKKFFFRKIKLSGWRLRVKSAALFAECWVSVVLHWFIRTGQIEKKVTDNDGINDKSFFFELLILDQNYFPLFFPDWSSWFWHKPLRSEKDFWRSPWSRRFFKFVFCISIIANTKPVAWSPIEFNSNCAMVVSGGDNWFLPI